MVQILIPNKKQKRSLPWWIFGYETLTYEKTTLHIIYHFFESLCGAKYL